MEMWVVKIGGSLQNSCHLNNWLQALKEHGAGQVVIVPGGGKFADAVREAQVSEGFDDVKAHEQALLAMEEYAQLLNSIAPEFVSVSDISSIHNCLAEKKVPIWLPHTLIKKDNTIPASWDVSSDSLAFWLALQLNINSVILIKTVPLPENYSGIHELVERGLIDPYSIKILDKSKLKVKWIKNSDSVLLSKIINGEKNKDIRNLIY
jgi:5-(aminomethyl)-3-furanmethanol phosphate kinase